MLINKKGNILLENDGIILHGCNTRGAFGGGLAGQIRTHFPIVYEAYKNYPLDESSLGKLQLVKIDENLWFINGFTQMNFGNDGKKYASPEAIFNVLNESCRLASSNLKIIKTVKLGCGLGGLDWSTDVLPVFEKISSLWPDVKIEIFEP